MKTVLQAYSINNVTEQDGCFELTVSDGDKRRLITIPNSPQPDEATKKLPVIIGRIPHDKADEFKSNCVRIGGLPTKEIKRQEDSGPIELKKILDYCVPSLTPPELGDILIIEEFDLGSLIEITLSRG
jgi:hypothetical protein